MTLTIIIYPLKQIKFFSLVWDVITSTDNRTATDIILTFCWYRSEFRGNCRGQGRPSTWIISSETR